MKRLAFLSAFCVLGFAGAAVAEALDATQRLSCVLAEASECDEQASCSDVTPEQIELPGNWRIDFAAKQLTSADGQRTSPIHALETQEAVLVLQGHQNGRGWTIVIERATGRLAASISDLEGVFVLAGGCSKE